MFDFDIFYHAAQALLQGQSPYEIGLPFFNPVWALLPFIPLTLLPIETARTIWSVTTWLTIYLALMRMKLDRVRILVLILLTPFVWMNTIYGNVDSLILLGSSLPPLTGIWIVILKPQIGLIVIALWAWRMMKKRDMIRLALLIFPVSLALIAQAQIIGWPHYPGFYSAASAFPWGLPLGAWLLLCVFRRDDMKTALASTAFVAPFFNITSWIVTLPLLASQSKRVTIILTALAWLALILWIIRGRSGS